ncbi:MAG: hypothetical protein U1A53_00900 [Prosthecobacter sp.]|nr:hypothetical protein [Prosthecobacter sp.]
MKSEQQIEHELILHDQGRLALAARGVRDTVFPKERFFNVADVRDEAFDCGTGDCGIGDHLVKVRHHLRLGRDGEFSEISAIGVEMPEFIPIAGRTGTGDVEQAPQPLLLLLVQAVLIHAYGIVLPSGPRGAPDESQEAAILRFDVLVHWGFHRVAGTSHSLALWMG